MGLETCHQLHRLFSPDCPATQDVIANFVKDRQNDFGHASLPKNLRAVHFHTVTNAVEQANRFTVALLADQPPTLLSQNVTSENLFDLRHTAERFWHTLTFQEAAAFV
ncbi:hypothetical protein N7466_008445 [Penicillium verhagenii]|uniref:uncharacterized protein n=1 Tax=Penicillium verhagenii TaxID=1562060 RepID=UPI0025450169|nr:uncharacterized protein N7466_008445 [Penicillium verhagenii]KAJ5924258.1 hypothetical protein N7466_008445 [Penicillium verhagenii]